MTNHSHEFEKAFEAARTVQLPEADRTRIRAILKQHATANPVRMSSSRRLLHKTVAPTPSPYYSWLIPKPMPALAFLIAATLLGGGTSYAAQGSLPGDLLYPVKVNVNEAVQEALALTPAAKANVEASLAATRLDEAQHLAAAGTVSSTTAAALVANFTSHAAAAAKHASEVAKTDPAAAAEIDSSLTARIAANKDILEAIAAKTATDTPEVNGIVASLTAHLDKAERENPMASSTAAENISENAFTSLQDRAQSRLDDVKGAIDGALKANVAGSVSATSTTGVFTKNAEDAIARAEQELTNASDALANGQKADAYAAYLASLSASAQAKAFIDASSRIRNVFDRAEASKPEAAKSGDQGAEHASATSTVARERALEIRKEMTTAAAEQQKAEVKQQTEVKQQEQATTQSSDTSANTSTSANVETTAAGATVSGSATVSTETETNQ